MLPVNVVLNFLSLIRHWNWEWNNRFFSPPSSFHTCTSGVPLSLNLSHFHTRSLLIVHLLFILHKRRTSKRTHILLKQHTCSNCQCQPSSYTPTPPASHNVTFFSLFLKHDRSESFIAPLRLLYFIYLPILFLTDPIWIFIYWQSVGNVSIPLLLGFWSST